MSEEEKFTQNQNGADSISGQHNSFGGVNEPVSTSSQLPALRKSNKQDSGSVASKQLNWELTLALSQRGVLHLERFEFLQAVEQFSQVTGLINPREEDNNGSTIVTLQQQELRAFALRGQAKALHALERNAEASTAIEEAIALLESYPGAELEALPRWLENLALALLTHAQILRDNDLARSEGEYHRALERLDALVVKLGNNCPPNTRLHLAMAIGSFAELFIAQQQSRDALSLVDRALTLLNEAPEHQEAQQLPEWQIQTARLQSQRSQALLIEGKMHHAAHQGAEANAVLTALRDHVQENGLPNLTLQYALNLKDRAQILASTGEHVQANTLLTEATTLFNGLQERLGENFGPHLWQALAKIQLLRSASEMAMAQPKSAEASCQQAKEILENLYNRQNAPHTPALLKSLAETYTLQGRIHALLGDTQTAMEAYDRAVTFLQGN